MRDEICYEEQAPALTGYQIANIRDSTLDPLVSTYMTRIPTLETSREVFASVGAILNCFQLAEFELPANINQT